MSEKSQNKKTGFVSVLLKIAAPYVLIMMLLLSLFALLRGHNDPGGGFIGGLIAGSGIFFHALANGTAQTMSMWFVKPRSLIVTGLLLVFATAVAGFFSGQTLLQAYWLKLDAGFLGQIKLGTPLLFDTGVFFAVAGSFLTIIISIMEEYGWK